MVSPYQPQRIENQKSPSTASYFGFTFRYLIDVSWMKKGKKYTGYDKWDQSGKWKSENFPGPVVTSSLFAGIHCQIMCSIAA